MKLQEYRKLNLTEKIRILYLEGTFITSIRYYSYKINLYLMADYYLEVFVDHKSSTISRIIPLDVTSARMKFYVDQIKLPDNLMA